MSISKYILVIFFLSHFETSYSQTHEQITYNIKLEFQRINSLNNLKQIELENEAFMKLLTDGGGSLIGYFEDEKLIKVIEKFGLSYGVVLTEFYLKDDQLIFVYQTEDHFGGMYDSLENWIGYDYKKSLENQYQGRYYFHDGRKVKVLQNGKRILSQHFEYDDFNTHLNNLVEIIKKESE